MSTQNKLRSSLTEQMLQTVAARFEKEGRSTVDVTLDIALDEQKPDELRFKASNSINSLVYPKASSVEMVIEDNKEKMSGKEIEDRITQLLSLTGISK